MDDLVKYKETIPLRGPSSDFGSLRADPSERDEVRYCRAAYNNHAYSMSQCAASNVN